MLNSKSFRLGLVGAVLLAGLANSSLPAVAAIGPNGLIAFSAFDGADRDIYTADSTNPSAEPVRLTTDGRSNENPDWSPDGSQIVYDSFLTTDHPRDERRRNRNYSNQFHSLLRSRLPAELVA